MLEAATSALQNLLAPMHLLFLFLGVLMGLGLGAIPGLGGLVGLAILLPFTFEMEPFTAFAIMLGLISVTSTSDVIPSVLFGVPGTVSSQATILDGHPMAKAGEAGRAFGAAYTASLVGGLFGALVLALSIPILRPIVLAFGSPEFFMMGLLGISMVAVLSGNAPFKGLIAGALGLSIGMVGMDPQAGVLRWTFSQLYLWDGVPLVPVALGVFAIPEIVDLVIRGTRIAEVPKEDLKGVTEGVKDAFRHWFLTLRCSVIGVWVGAIPGLGGPVVDWFAYGHAAQSEKDASKSFGKGDVRGVIAPESASNAKEGGALIPTIAFGVPGSAPMALLLGAMTIQGLTPGSAMLGPDLDVTYTLIWSLAIANIFGAGICLLLTNQLSKIARVRIGLLAPIVIVMVFLASFQGTQHYGDLWSLLLFSILGWLMKRFGWPRPPLILGVILSGIVENYLFISIARYGDSWLSRPLVLLIGVLTLASLIYGLRNLSKSGQKIFQGRQLKIRFNPGLLFAFFLLLVFFLNVYLAWEWPYQARLFPWAISVPALLLCLLQVWIELFQEKSERSSQSPSASLDLPVDPAVPVSNVIRRAARVFAWIGGFFFAIWLMGFMIAIPLFVFCYLRLQAQETWRTSLLSTGAVLVFVMAIFHYVLRMHWPAGVIAAPQELFLRLAG